MQGGWCRMLMGKSFLVFVCGKVFVPSYIQGLCATVAIPVLCE